MKGTVLYGTGGIVLFGLALVSVAFQPKPAREELLEACAPWIQLAVFGILSACLIAVGRTSWRAGNAIATRYTSQTNFLWIGTLVSGFVALGGILRTQRRAVRAVAAALVLLAGAAAAVGYTRTYRSSYRKMAEEAAAMDAGLDAFYDYRKAPEGSLELIFMHTDRVREWASTLERRKEGPFHPVAQALYRLRLEKESAEEKELLAGCSSGERVLPASAARLARGTVADLIATGDWTSFTTSGAAGPVFEVSAAGALPGDPPGPAPGGHPALMGIVAERAVAVRIRWKGRPGFPGSVEELFPRRQTDGFRHCWAVVPAGAEECMLALDYSAEGPVTDRLRLALCR